MNSIFIVLPILTLLMFDLGLTLKISDFAEFVHKPRAVIVGLLGQLVVLPAIAFFLASLLDLSPVFAIGLVLIACCPGGSSSNIFSKLAGGDVPLSVSLTAITSIVTIFTIPLILQGAMSMAGHQGLLVKLPVGTLLMQNIVLMLVPILVGMAVNRKWPAIAERIEKKLSKLAFPALMLLAAIFFIQHRHTIADNFVVLGGAVLLLLCISISCGAMMAHIARLDACRRRTIVIEVGMQNAAQAIAIASSPFALGDGVFAIPAIIYALMMNIVLLSYVAVCQRIPTFKLK